MATSAMIITVLFFTATPVTKPAPHTQTSNMTIQNPFFAMDTATRDEHHQTVESQLRMLKDLGFAGWSIHESMEAHEVLRFGDTLNLRLFSIYANIDLDRKWPPWDPKLPDTIRAMKGRSTILWIYITSKTHNRLNNTGDQAAVKAIRQLAEMASQSDLSVSLYPHYGFYVATVRDAIDLAKKVNRQNVGLTFNLCHWLRADEGKDLDNLLQQALPHLQMVTINGADTEGGWDRLIQPLGHGSFDVYGFVSRLIRLGYHGPIGLQGYGVKGDVENNLKQAMRTWSEYNSRLSLEMSVKEKPRRID